MTGKRYFALYSEGDIYPIFFDGEEDDRELDVEEVVELLNEHDKKIKELTEEKNYFERAYQEFIEFADKKAKELGYPSYCTDVINEIITQKEMEE